MSLEPYHRLGLALAIGLVVGVERGWRERELAEGGRTAGIRTYALIGLLIGLGGLLGQVLGDWAFAALVSEPRSRAARSWLPPARSWRWSGRVELSPASGSLSLLTRAREQRLRLGAATAIG